MLAGVVVAYVLMKLVFDIDAYAPALLVGSIVAGLLTVAMINFVSKVSRIKDDTAIGIMYTGIFAFGGVLASYYSSIIHIDLVHFVVGSVLAVQDSELWLMAMVAAAVLGFVILFYRHLQIATFDPVMAASLGISVIALDYALTTCTSMVVVSAVNIVGVILVVGLLVTPAASAYLLCDRLSTMLWVSALLAESSVIIGLYLSKWFNVASGSAIVVVSTAQFLVVLLIAPRYGLIADWLRRRSIVPQDQIEDVLVALEGAKQDAWVAWTDLAQQVELTTDELRRAIAAIRERQLIEEDNHTVRLTATGHREARRLVRAQRIWEAYLDHLGTPTEQLREKSHQLEHVHDEDTVDYLDDKLGHPLVSPRGAEIPEDFVHLVPGQRVKASLLREGHRAEIVAVGIKAQDRGLKAGLMITAGPRRDGGRLWTFQLPSGEDLALDHATADEVTVVLAS